MSNSLRLVIISDTHGLHDQINLPDGDILIHAGDFTYHGTLEEVEAFNTFLNNQPHPYKLVIAGNHDFCFQDHPKKARSALTAAEYLEDTGVKIAGFHFYGSPWQPWFMDFAFNLRSSKERAAKWALIPKDTDILITHSPPLGYGDLINHGQHVGCHELLTTTEQIKPRLHIFGHIHEDYGITKNHNTAFINACICDLYYQPIQQPIVIDIAK